MRDAKTCLLICLWSACGGKHPDGAHQPPPPPPPAVTCASAISNALAVGGDGLPPQLLPKLHDAITAVCDGDKWPPNVVACFAKAKTDPETNACAKDLTAAQQDHVKQVVETTIGDDPGMKKKDDVASKPDSEPEFFPPAWKAVGVGQKVSFQTSTIDQDLDETRVTVDKMPASATFDAITQTVRWTPTKADKPQATFSFLIEQPGRGKHTTAGFTVEVTDKVQPPIHAEDQSPIVETILMIHDAKRLAQVNKDWPLEKLLEVGADAFKLQTAPDKRGALTQHLDGKTSFQQLLTQLAITQNNPRLDPRSPSFDKASFGDPATWKIVAFRPRIDRQWTELRVVYKAGSAVEPVYAMFRLRPVVEYVPALPRPDEERIANNKLFLELVAKHLMKDGGPNPKFTGDVVAHGKAVSALMTELMAFDDTKTAPYLHGFMIGIAAEARMGGGSARNDDGSYKSGDGWAWSALKPFQTALGSGQAYVNVAIPGFWTEAVASKDGKAWVAKCAQKFDPNDPKHDPGYEVLCRKTMGLVDLPAMKDGHPSNGKIDANNLYVEHKLHWASAHLPLEDSRRDSGEENGMTCSQCHIRNFGMHDWHDPAATDPSAGVPKALNHKLATLDFQIIPASHWSAFTLEFLQHQECRAKQNYDQYAGGAKGLTCPLLK